MILQAIELENFRQFRGQQRIDLGTSRDRNVTVVYGANGAGKTSLLNAFTWVLYKQCTPGFERPDHLLNEEALNAAAVGEEVAATVRLEFEHEGRKYEVARTTSYKKNAEGGGDKVKDATPSVSFTDEDGEYHNRDTTFAGTVGEVLPERLHRFFFFDGERIEQLVKPDAYAEIEEAIKGILGLQVVENAIKHTDEARKDLERELRDFGTDEDRALTDELDTVRARIRELREDQDQRARNYAELETDLRGVNARLAELKDAAELQRAREELEQELEEVEAAMRESRSSLANKIAQSGWRAFADGLAERTTTVFEERRERREVPSDLKRQFVEDLLEDGRCICGCALTPGSDSYDSVAAWREKSVQADVEAKWIRLPAVAKHTLTQREELFEYLHETIGEQQRHREQRTRVQDKLSAISDTLLRGADETVKGLEAQRESIQSQMADSNRQRGRAEGQIDELLEQEKRLERDLDRARDENTKAEVARLRVNVARSSARIFAEILRLRTEEVRRQLDTRIKMLYESISFKPYVPGLDERFRLDLRSTEGSRSSIVAKSTGENQILSLSFVGALAEHARDRWKQAQADGSDGPLSFQGGIYPVVMDSPFGSLDTNYQERVAEAIPRLAEQVIVFVSQSQGLGAVQEHMRSRIHREYVINFCTPKPDFEEESIELSSGKFPYISRSQDGERAELIAVN